LHKSFIQNKQLWDSNDTLSQQKIILNALVDARAIYKKETFIDERKPPTWGKKLKRFILGSKHSGGI
jgi:hypothetical protein